MADLTPGVSTSFDRSSDASGIAPNSRALIWGLVPAGAPAPVGVPFLVTSLSQLVSEAGARWAQLVRNYLAAKAEPASSGAEIWVMPVADPAGTAATRIFTFAPAPTFSGGAWVVGSGSALTQATDCTIDLGGQVVTFSVASGTTWANLAAAAHAALTAYGSDLVYSSAVNSATVTITDKHASAITDDLPIRVSFSNPNCGGAVICGTVTLASTATGAGAVVVSDGVTSASDVIANNDTVTTTATQLAAAVNASMGYRAATDAGAAGVVTLYYLPDRYARRLSVSVTGTPGTTASLAAGTAGSGTPSLTSALAYLAGQPTAYRAWALAQADATALGAVAASVISEDAVDEKGQMVFAAISGALPASSLIAATTPALSTTELCVVLHAQAATVPAAQIAARVAVQVASEGEGDQGRNYNGLPLTPSESMPLAAAHRSDRSNKDSWNAAISQGYAPVKCDDQGRWSVVFARTTWGSSDPTSQKLKKWSGALLPMYFRADLRSHLTRVFFKPGEGRSLKAIGKPHTDRGVDQAGVKSEVLTLVKKWDRADYFDGLSGVAAAMQVSVTGGRVKVYVPFRSVADFDRLDVVGTPA